MDYYFFVSNSTNSNLDEESDQDSVAEESGQDEAYEGSLQHLDRMKHFVLESAAYQILLR